MSFARNLLKFAANKYAHPRARIAFGSRVAGNSHLGENVSIGPDCYVVNAQLGDVVTIERDTAVFDSTLQANSLVSHHCAITDVNLGSYSYIAEQAIIAYATIGRFCSIGPAMICGYGSHPLDFVSTSPVFYSTRKQCGVTFADQDEFQESERTVIGNDVWIGARVFVRDGVRIGNGAIVAAGAVVVDDVADYSVVGGVPAKIIRHRFSDPVIKELLEIAWWNWSEPDLRAARSMIAQNDIDAFLQWARQR
jgi:chloramphenicol O-acetyltransferase type B